MKVMRKEGFGVPNYGIGIIISTDSVNSCLWVFFVNF